MQVQSASLGLICMVSGSSRKRAVSLATLALLNFLHSDVCPVSTSIISFSVEHIAGHLATAMRPECDH